MPETKIGWYVSMLTPEQWGPHHSCSLKGPFSCEEVAVDFALEMGFTLQGIRDLAVSIDREFIR